MKKTTKKLIIGIAVVMLMMTVLCFSASAKSDEYYFTVENGEATITGVYELADADVIIPENLGDYKVTAIGDSAFSSIDIESITIPDTVTSIGQSAFCMCYKLTDVELGNGITEIKPFTFCECISLEKIEIPESVTKISRFAFQGCLKLKSVKTGNNLIEIDKYAFDYCTSLNDFQLPSSLEIIGDSAFRLNNKVSMIPENVNYIGTQAFLLCTNESFLVHKENKNYSNDERGVLYNKEQTEIIQYPIANNETSYTIPNGVTSIEPGAFYSCIFLKEITIPESMMSINSSAFMSCLSLTKVNIPNSVKSIGDYAFSECSNITAVYFDGSKEEWNDINIGIGNENLTDANIHFNANSVHTHSYTTAVTPATCTANGKVVYTCSCGDTYSETIPATGHDYQNGICTKCGDADTTLPEDPSADCTCNCHKSGFMGFIWKIICFFQKLFKLNPLCDCGVAHY